MSRWNTRCLQHFRYSIFWKAVHICIHTYITSLWEKNNVTFWMKSAAFTSKPQGLWRKECYNITDPSRQSFPPLAPTSSYPDVRVLPSHRRDQSFLLSLSLCNGFPTLCFLFSVPLLWTWPRQLSGLQTSQFHGPCSPDCFSFLLTSHFWYNFSSPTDLSFSVLGLLFFLSKFMVSFAFSSPHFASFNTFHTSYCKSLSDLLHCLSDTFSL